MSCTRQRGFTLLELMITLAVLAILSTIAFPSMRDFIKRDRVVAKSNSLQGDLQLARGQAAAARQYVSICPIDTAGGTTCSSTAAYDQGWLIYTSANPGASYDGTAADLLRVGSAPSGVSIRADQAGILTFDARGALLVVGNPDISVNFISCAKASNSDDLGINTTAVPGVQLNVSGSGRVASASLPSGAACMVTNKSSSGA